MKVYILTSIQSDNSAYIIEDVFATGRGAEAARDKYNEEDQKDLEILEYEVNEYVPSY